MADLGSLKGVWKECTTPGSTLLRNLWRISLTESSSCGQEGARVPGAIITDLTGKFGLSVCPGFALNVYRGPAFRCTYSRFLSSQRYLLGSLVVTASLCLDVLAHRVTVHPTFGSSNIEEASARVTAGQCWPGRVPCTTHPSASLGDSGPQGLDRGQSPN